MHGARTFGSPEELLASVRRVTELEAEWNARHPVYSRLLLVPVLGPRLRRRRSRYVKWVLSVR